jgi:hypothetical protein
MLLLIIFIDIFQDKVLSVYYNFFYRRNNSTDEKASGWHKVKKLIKKLPGFFVHQFFYHRRHCFDCISYQK